MAIDFLGEDNDPQPVIQQSTGRDFLSENSEPPESLGTSAAMAIPRVATDVAKGAYKAFQSIPDYWNAAKTEVPGAIKDILLDPKHAAGQFTAGLAEQGQNVFNTPHDLINYMTNRLNLIPQNINQKVQMARMPDSEEAINERFGQPLHVGEKLIRGGGRNSIGASAVSSALSAVNPVGLGTTKKSITNSILNSHDTLENRASQGFKKVSEQVNKRGINTLPVSSKMIDDLQDYFPNTKQANSLLTQARTGDYNALRKLQSDLYTRGKKNLGSSLETDRMRGEEMLEKRNDINDTISTHLKNTGNHDLDKILNKAKDDYRTLQNVYYNPNVSNSIVKMVDKDIRKIPTNLTTILQENSKPMQNLRDYHPGLERRLNKHLYRNNALSTLGKYGIPVGLGGLGAYAAENAMNLNGNANK